MPHFPQLCTFPPLLLLNARQCTITALRAKLTHRPSLRALLTKVLSVVLLQIWNRSQRVFYASVLLASDGFILFSGETSPPSSLSWKKFLKFTFLSGKYFSKPTLRLSSSSPSPFSLSVFNWFILNTWFVHKLCFWTKSNLKICQYDHCFIIWPILQGCVELLGLLNTAGDQEDFHLHSFSEIEDQPSNIPLPHPKQKF